MVGKISEMTDGVTLNASDRFEITRDPLGTPLTRWIDGADISARSLADHPAASVTVKGKVELATIAEVNTGTDATRAVTPDSLEGSALQIKVDGIEASADVTDAASVNTAGAVMTSDVASTTAKGSVELATVTETDTGTDTGRVITPVGLAGSALQTKVDGIEASADVTDTANIVSAGAFLAADLATITETNTGTDATLAVTPAGLAGSALQIKVDGIEDAADVTDTTNVTAAGAAMLDGGGKILATGYTVGAAHFNAQTGTTYTLTAADDGKTVTLNNAAAITLTVPSGLGAGFRCTVIQIGAGQVTFSASGTTVNSLGGFVKISGQHGVGGLLATLADTFALAGDLVA